MVLGGQRPDVQGSEARVRHLDSALNVMGGPWGVDAGERRGEVTLLIDHHTTKVWKRIPPFFKPN